MRRLRINNLIKKPGGGGYTIIELMFAVVNFSFVMIIALSAFVVVMRVYNKSAFTRQTQQVGRAAIDKMISDIRLATLVNTGYPPTYISPSDTMCLQISSASGSSVRYAKVIVPSTTRNKITRTTFSDTNCGTSLVSENLTPDDFDVTGLQFIQVIEDAHVIEGGVTKKGTGISIDLTLAKGTASPDPSDPFYNATNLRTFVNARGGS